MTTPENSRYDLKMEGRVSPVDVTFLEAPGVRAIIFPDGDSVIVDDQAKKITTGTLPKEIKSGGE